MGSLDTGIIGPVLPSIEQSFQLTSRESSWIFTLFVIFFMIGSPIMAKFSDFYGRKKIFILDVILFGISFTINGKVYKIRRKIGVVFQDYKLLPKSTVFENVAFALEIFGLPKDEIHSKVVKVLDLVGLKSKIKNYPAQLSGGEQQRVAIARAIVNGPKLLICDEPTGNLDPNTSMEIMKVLEEINKLGTTIIMVTHDIDIVKEMNKRVIVLDSGRVLKDYEKGTYK